MCDFQETLSNQIMKPSLLKPHQSSKHTSTENKPIAFFRRKVSYFQKESKFMMNFTSFNASIVKASYLSSLYIVKDGQPHTIGETLVFSAAKEIVSGAYL